MHGVVLRNAILFDELSGEVDGDELIVNGVGVDRKVLFEHQFVVRGAIVIGKVLLEVVPGFRNLNAWSDRFTGLDSRVDQAPDDFLVIPPFFVFVGFMLGISRLGYHVEVKAFY